MYGIDSYVLRPPLGMFVSLLLVSGCDGIGWMVLRAFGFGSSNAQRWHRWQAPIVGAMVLSIVLYPLALAHLTPLAFMRLAAVLVASIGLVNLLAMARGWPPRWLSTIKTARETAAFQFWSVLLVLLLAGAALMALGPVTDADSLDYHMGVPVALLIHGGMPFTPEWLHGRLAGSYEVLNALGLAAGTDNLGATLQFAGMVGIAGLLLFAESSDESHRSDSTATGRTMVTVAALSAPVLVALISQKPELLPIAMTSLALALVIYPSRRRLTGPEALKGYALICLLALSASQAKLSFMLGGGVVGLLSLAVMARRGLFWPAVAIGAFAVLLIVAPGVLWKHHYFHDTFINSLVKAMPGSWPGNDVFDVHLRRFVPRTTVPLPLLMIVPLRLGNITVVLGPAVLILLLALRPRRDPWAWTVIGAVIFVIAVLWAAGPRLSRYYLEPYFWLLMLLAIQPTPKAFIQRAWMTWPLAVQALFAVALFWFGAVTLFPGALTSRWRSAVMDRYANGYRVMKWADTVLPADAVLLSYHRSIALAPRDAVSFDWSTVVRVNSPAAEPYLQRLKDRGVTHVLIDSSPRFMGLSACLGPMVAGPGDDRVVVRNPFVAERHYPAWIFKLNSELLPNCAFSGAE